MSGWNPDSSNSTNGRGGWGKSSESRDNYGPEVCWNRSGDSLPISFEEMSEVEKILFATDVNSPLKAPPQNLNKDLIAQGTATNGRKTSFSHGQSSGAFGVSSPVSSRPGTRRQLTTDSISGLQSPSGTGRFPRDEASPFSNRKISEAKDGQDDRSDDPKSGNSFGGLMRSNTAGNASGNGPLSPWAPSSAVAAMTPMGNFGNFALGGPSANPPTPIEKKPVFGRGESRLAHLMNQESTEDMSKAAERPWRPRQRTDTDPFGDDAPSGSAALGGHDSSPPLNAQQRGPGIDTPARGNSSDFGMSEMPGFHNLAHRQLHQTPARHDASEPMSPSDTNPYRSPPDDKHNAEDSSYDGEHPHHSRVHDLGGNPEHAANTLGGLPRAFNNAVEGSDRSQTSSAGGNRAFSTLSGLPSGFGGLGGWPTGGNPVATPDRENRPAFPSNAFGSSVFGPMGELQSPSLGLNSMFGPSGGASGTNTNTIGRGGSKLGSLFPAAMQAQMQNAELEQSGDGGDTRQSTAFGAIGRNAYPPRETDSPLRTGRHIFDDLFAASDASRNQGPFSSAENGQGQTTTSFSQVSVAAPMYGQSQASSDSASNQLPASQQRMMVMPDRMRWVYLDPQGKVQGPWSGLEMHDWYKASFFTADLSVKKVEDTDFEPLGQLIRRIGNSREPFLVPQIGIPHGPAPAQGPAFAPATTGPGNAAQPGAVQPPFANSFPSFGTTLTAEQQNNLERRKQEEQFLMARQKEFLAQQQVNVKQMQMGGIPSALHHHSSAHSLQSQPSFGSITSPIGLPQTQIQNVAGFYDGAPRQFPAPSTAATVSDFFREEELARLSLRDRQQLFNPPIPVQQQSTHAQQITSLFGPNVESQRITARMEQDDPSGFNARLEEFQQLRAQHELEEASQAAQGMTEPIGPPQPQQHSEQPYHDEPEPEPGHTLDSVTKKQQAPLSLTEQVQNAKTTKESPTAVNQPESPWGKPQSSGFPMPFPPPQSTTPLPAPTAQRGRSNLPEALNVESRSRSETPEVVSVTPSLAPWAKEQTEAPKGPSLKEIQEAEAKKAAKVEEIAAATRRANYEYELKLLANQPNAPAPGLPTTSTWGNTASPAMPSNAPSAWAKPAASKVQVLSSTAAAKKTLADIQREEESRKLKAAAAVAASQPAVSTGKRYADLASKVNPAPAPIGGSPWSTVGAGGKVRVPTGPAAVAPQVVRTVSNVNVATASAPRNARTATATRSTPGPVSAIAAKEEFVKWAKAVLTNGLNPDINVDEFVVMLREFPPEASIIADSIYANSKLMNGNDFAVEFLRRRALSEKGIVEPANNGTGFSADKSGGWNEVAKKGPPKVEEPATGFKVVPNKKKGRK
ncbi:hypothetical protein PZA11_000017 [Diplocarpon coronariae]